MASSFSMMKSYIFLSLLFAVFASALDITRPPKDYLFIEDPDVDPSKYDEVKKTPTRTLAAPPSHTTKTTTISPQINHERSERQIPIILPMNGMSGIHGLGNLAGLSSGFQFKASSCDKLKMYLAMVGQAEAIETTQIADHCIPKVKYTVKKGPNGVGHVVNDDGDYSNKGSDKGILCEFSSVEKCPEGYELFRHSCYKYFDDTVDYPKAKSACEAQEGWLPKIRDDEINRYIASVAFRNKNSRTWIGASGSSGDWKESDDKHSLVVYFRWLVYNLTNKAKNAVMMTSVVRENSKWFGYWEDTNEVAKHPYICAVKPTIGEPNLELIPSYSGAYKA